MSAENQPLDALDRIAFEARADEADRDATEQAILNPEKANAPDPALAWAQMPKMFGGILAMAMPELADVYSDDACLQWGSAMAQVAEKHGWDAGETMSKWAPEIALAVASFPLVVPTIAAIKKKRSEGRKTSLAEAQKEEAEIVESVSVPKDEQNGGDFETPK